jgi:asparagine synthase (glutamine-hydrolysing)
MPQWLNGPLSKWVDELLAKRVSGFSEIVDEEKLGKKIRSLTAAKAWDWESAGRLWPYLNLKWTLGQHT